jgi:hypothetical protein
METLLDTADFTLQHDPAQHWLYATWRGPHPGRSVQARCTTILEQVVLTKSVKILNDGSLDLDGWGELVPWLRQEYFQLLAANGVVAVAWVMPDNLCARAHMNQVLSTITCPLVDVFADAELAYRWLHSLSSATQAVAAS